MTTLLHSCILVAVVLAIDAAGRAGLWIRAVAAWVICMAALAVIWQTRPKP